MHKRFKELSAWRVNIWTWNLTGDGVRPLTALSWFVAAFLAGVALFLATRPVPVLQALVEGLRPNLFERCRDAGACTHLEIAPPAPKRREMPPSDMDRA
jgi:hypothetical protein